MALDRAAPLVLYRWAPSGDACHALTQLCSTARSGICERSPVIRPVSDLSSWDSSYAQGRNRRSSPVVARHCGEYSGLLPTPAAAGPNSNANADPSAGPASNANANANADTNADTNSTAAGSGQARSAAATARFEP